ncbi:response regulator transcription factor [Stenotrophomonas sp. SY1]|uniref:response regulator transcription factor n=1 Tax=Stenotrophomonas sp. SY1 TaxID=477235 RepID=UPI001E5384AE|nr:response regulator transcription factor [Stenotrophomonas sp. SY1]MCD9087083.1 response regulator transcription factor [Stenotrophomonas sp. SY1]
MGISQSVSAPFRKVVVVDDHKVVAQGIELLLMDSFEVVTLTTSGEELMELVRRDPPDIVVSDISMPGMSGIDTMRLMRKEGIDLPVVFLTMHDEPSIAAEAIRAGACGYVLKTSAGDELVDALNSVMSGCTYITPTLAARAIKSSERCSRYVLTSRQLRILEYSQQGMRSKQIAHELGLSVRTIDSHKYAVMQMMGVHSTLELICKAVQEGLIRR